MNMGKFEAKDEDLQSTDWRAYFDSSCLRVWHLTGKDRTFKIARVTRLTSEMISGNKREVKKQPKLELTDQQGRPVPLPLLLNKTNAKTIAQMYGNNPSAWVGKLVTLFPSTTSVGGEERECIRIRPKIPSATAKRGQQPAPEPEIKAEQAPEREPGQDDDEPPMGALETDHAN
jgi:hypothetical protein